MENDGGSVAVQPGYLNQLGPVVSSLVAEAGFDAGMSGGDCEGPGFHSKWI